MPTLHLHARPDLAAAAFCDADAGAPLVLGGDHLGLDALVDDAWAAVDAGGRGRPQRVGPVGEALLIDQVAGEAAGPLGGVAGTEGLRRTLLRVFLAAGQAGISAALFERLAGRLGMARVAEVARLYGRYREVLGYRLADEAGVWRRGVAALAKAPPGVVRQATEIDVHGLALCGARRATPTLHGRFLLLGALAAPEDGPAVPVRVLLPAVEGRPALEAALSPLLESLYRHHEAGLEEVRVPLGPVVDDARGTPWGRFLQGLFQPGRGAPPVQAGELPATQLSFHAAPSPGAEAQGVARAVRDLIDFGVAPARIGIVAQQPARRTRLLSALRRYGVPIRPLPPLEDPGQDHQHSIGLAPPIRVLLGLYDLIDQGVPREGLIQHLTTRYARLAFFDRGPLQPSRVARALREAGIRDLRPGPRNGRRRGVNEPDYHRRLSEWLRQQELAGGTAGPSASVMAAVEAALGQLDGLPEHAPIAAHVQALLRLCDRLRWAELSRGLGDGLGDGDGVVDDSAALSRDQEAVAALLDVLAEMPHAAQRLGRHREAVPRARFAGLLAGILTQRALRPRGAEGAAVDLGELLAVAGGRYDHIFVAGLVEGELPGHTAEDPVLSDDERRGLNRLLARDVFPLAQDADAGTPLWLAQALGHCRAAHFSWPLADEQGRPLLRSAYVDDILHAAAQDEPPRGEHAVVPAQDQARCAAELWSRAMLDGWGGTSTPRSRDRSLFTALSRHDPRRAERLLAIVEIERRRLRWFASRLKEDPGRTEAGPFAGQLADEALRAALTSRLPGSPEHPLSASALEDYAKCPFRFFVRRVLKAAPVQEGGDDLDPLAGGRLHHKVLEDFFLSRRKQGRLPLRGDAEDLAALDGIIDEVLRSWPETEQTGHTELFAVRIRRLREDLRRLVEREARQPIEEGCVPHLFEHKFGPLSISSAGERDGGLPLHIHGVIDRVDVGQGRALVLDYKAGRLDRYEAILRHDLLDTSFQLPLYAAALRADPKLLEMGITVEQVSARYYSLRHGRASQGKIDDQQMISLNPAEQARAPERNVAEVAYRLWRRLRDGDFRVDPRSCEGCGLEAACRVNLVQPSGDLLAEAGPGPQGTGTGEGGT